MNKRGSEYSEKCEAVSLKYLKQNPKKLAEYLTYGFYSKIELKLWALTLSESFLNQNTSETIDELEIQSLKLIKKEPIEYSNTMILLFSEIKKSINANKQIK